MDKPLRILFIGGSEDDFALATLVLRKANPDLDALRVTDAAAFAQALVKGDFNFVITENRLGWATGLSLVDPIRARCPSAPIFMFTESGDEETAAQAVGHGVDLYLPKNPRNFLRLPDIVGSHRTRPETVRPGEVVDTHVQALLDEGEIGTFRATLEGHLISANAAFLGMSGLDALETTEHFNLQGLDARPGDWAARIRRLQEQGHFRDTAAHLRRTDGDPIWLALTQTLDVTPAGEAVVDGLVVDVTERRQLERTLQDKIEELARSNADLEQFAYTASHELQEPLRTLERYTRLLKDESGNRLTREAKESMEFVLEATRRMHRLVEDLLSYSRVVTRGHPFQSVDCERLLEQTLANLKASIDESKAKITHDPLPTLNADSGQLMSLLQNLVGNALKFRNCHSPKVHVSAERKEREWVFSVRDNGIGFDPKQNERIFGIFQRLHTEAEYPGTGVGLAICKRIVERHAGRIWTESEPGKGSTFYFSIPDKIPEPASPLPEA